MIREEEIDLDTLMNYIKKRVNANKNWLVVTTGSPGSAKSYSNLRCGEEWYDFWFKEKFPIENVCFSIDDVMDGLTKKGNRPGELYILEEAGTLINSKDFQSKINKLFNFYMQSFRCKNIILMFNLPLLGQLDKSTRLLVHSHFITSKVIKTAKVCHIKPFFIQVNQDTEKVYRKYLRKSVKREEYYFKYPVKVIGFGIPSKELCKLYEKKKADFVDSLGEDVKATLREIRAGKKKVITYRMREINTCWHKLNIRGHNKISEKISEWNHVLIHRPSVSRDMYKMDALFPEWRENPKRIGFVTVVT